MFHHEPCKPSLPKRSFTRDIIPRALAHVGGVDKGKALDRISGIPRAREKGEEILETNLLKVTTST